MSEEKYTDEFFKEYEQKFIPAAEKKQTPPPIPPEDAPKKKKGKELILSIIAVVLVVAIAAITVFVISIIEKLRKEDNNSSTGISASLSSEPKIKYFTLHSDDKTITLTNQVNSEYAVLIDADTGRIVAQKSSKEVIYPASMTKVLTLLTAVEQIDDFDDTYTVKFEDINSGYSEGASMAGFSENEVVKVKDLLYGTVLPSGADATTALASYISGSEAEFVKLMNKKVEELGINTAHFENTSGLHNANHYCTVEDIAVIMKAAMENDVCKEILSAYQYTTSITPEHTEGILLTSTLFSRMYGNEPEVARITAGKTGFTNEAGNCVVSYGTNISGKNYIFVTAMAHGMWKSVFDHIYTYRDFTN